MKASYRTVPAALALTATGVLAGAVQAESLASSASFWQEPIEERAPGWVGFRVNFIAGSAAQAQSGRYTVVVGDVDPGSPAWNAGMESGDTLVLINGTEASPSSFQALREELHAGDELHLAVRGASGERVLAVIAGARPFLVVGQAPGQMVVRIDSLRTAILRNADSLRGEVGGRPLVLEAREFNVRADSFITVLEVGEGESVAIAQGNVSVRSADGSIQSRSWTFRYESPGTPQAFETRIVYGPRTDSVRASIQVLKARLELVSLAEARNRQELVRIREATSDAARTAGDEPQLQRLEAVRQALQAELEVQQAALRDLSRQELGSAPTPPVTVEVIAPSVEVAPVVPEPPEPSTAISPYVVGRNYLAGAEVTTLKERLAVYFAVEDGVLVTEVARRTPADQAGLTPGDVIVAVNGLPVRTVQQLRTRLSRQWEGAVLSVVRKGEERELVLNR